jgi:hypothetical protein
MFLNEVLPNIGHILLFVSWLLLLIWIRSLSEDNMKSQETIILSELHLLVMILLLLEVGLSQTHLKMYVANFLLSIFTFLFYSILYYSILFYSNCNRQLLS